MMEEFRRKRDYLLCLQYVDASIEARRKGEDIIDLGMGNPDIPRLNPSLTSLWRRWLIPAITGILPPRHL